MGDICLSCVRVCCHLMGDLRFEPRFFPHEVKRGLHLKFPFKVYVVGGVEIVVLDPNVPCSFLVNDRCVLYGSGDMPLDCMIYPAMPTPDGDIVIDYDGCPMAKYFDCPEYRDRVRSLLKPVMPSRGWLEAYWRLG